MTALVLPHPGLWLPDRRIVPALPEIARRAAFALLGARRALLSRQPVAAAGGGAFTYATWNPSDKSTNITLSGGNLVAAPNANTTTWDTARSTIGKSAGKHYWEVTITSIGPGVAVGAVAGTEDLNCDGAMSQLDGFRVYFGGTGNKYKPATAYGASYTTGDVLGVALDMDGGTLALYKNNTSQGTLVSGLTGTYYAAAYLYNNGTASSVTANFGATALTYTPPAGFNAGLYT